MFFKARVNRRRKKSSKRLWMNPQNKLIRMSPVHFKPLTLMNWSINPRNDRMTNIMILSLSKNYQIKLLKSKVLNLYNHQPYKDEKGLLKINKFLLNSLRRNLMANLETLESSNHWQICLMHSHYLCKKTSKLILESHQSLKEVSEISNYEEMHQLITQMSLNQ